MKGCMYAMSIIVIAYLNAKKRTNTITALEMRELQDIEIEQAKFEKAHPDEVAEILSSMPGPRGVA